MAKFEYTPSVRFESVKLPPVPIITVAVVAGVTPFRLNEIVWVLPAAKPELVKAILPIPPHVVGLVAVPSVRVDGILTVTLPEILADVQLAAFLTVKLKLIELPEAGELKLTVMGLTGKFPSVTLMMPVPEIEYKFGVPVAAEYGTEKDVAPVLIAGMLPKVRFGNEGSVSSLIPEAVMLPMAKSE